MILVIVKEGGTRYESYGKTDEQLRKVQATIRENKSALCPECLAPMQIRIYPDKKTTNHFYHLPGSGTDCTYGAGESDAHLMAKTAIRKYLESRPDWDECEFLFEHRIETPDGIRVIDLAVIKPNGEKEAHEAQLSYQSGSVFDERSEVYQAAGFTPIWWIGDKNRNMRQHLYSKYRWVGTIEVSETPHDFGTEEYTH